MENRERAKTRNKKNNLRTILLEEKHENFIEVVRRKWEMLVATKVKISDSEKQKGTGTHKTFPP